MRAIVAVLGVAWLAGAALAQRPPLRWQPQDSGVTARLRGVSVVSDAVAWASGARGTVLRTTDSGRTWQPRPVPDADALDFRDVDAMSAEVAYVLSIGPGDASRIYKTVDGGGRWTRQFGATDPQVFLDAMAFWDPSRGVAVSDSANGRFLVVTTIDGGARWTPVPSSALPAALPGEGAFAASGTNVAVQAPGHIWIATTKSRVLHSADGGATWRVSTTPIATGEATGIFSIAFRDARHGVVVGGNYQQEATGGDNVATTADGGATWSLARPRSVGGLRSVVVWLAGTPAAWLAAGPAGADWSIDDGRSWAPAGGDGYDTLAVTADGRVGWAAGANGRIARVTRE